MARKLKLVKSELLNVDFLWLGAYRLRVDAEKVAGSSPTDPNVFLYQRNLPDPYDGTVTDVFLTIASPVDMAEYPVGEPNAATAYPFYRLPYVELDLRATRLAHEAWIRIVQEVNNLLLALDRMEQLVRTEAVWVGGGTEVFDPEDEGGLSTSWASSQSQSVTY